MKNKQTETEEEELVLELFKSIYGKDAIHFRYNGSEVVELMAMAYKTGQDDARKEKK